MKRAIGYLRVSQARSDDKLSPDIQRQRIKDYCKSKKWELQDIYEDIDIRGATFDRPGWVALEQSDDYDVIVTTEYTRIGRNLRETLNRTHEINESGKDIVAIDDDIDTTTAMGKAAFHMALLMAQFVIDRHSERMKALHSELARKGRWRGGPLPLGYKYGEGVEIDEIEAQLVRRIFDMRISGHGLNRIAAVLYKEGVRGKRGGHFTATSIGKILDNRNYIKEREVQGEIYPLEIPLIIDRQTWELSRAMKRRDIKFSRGQYALSGLLKCGKCGAGLTHCKANTYPAKWVCSNMAKHRGCNGVTILGHLVEPEVERRFFTYFDSAKYKQALKLQDKRKKTRLEKTKSIEQKMSAIEQRRSRLLELYLGDNITMSQFHIENDRISGEISRLKSEVDSVKAIDEIRKPLGNISEDWTLLSPVEQREILGLYIDRIVVKPGRLPPDKRLMIYWL